MSNDAEVIEFVFFLIVLIIYGIFVCCRAACRSIISKPDTTTRRNVTTTTTISAPISTATATGGNSGGTALRDPLVARNAALQHNDNPYTISTPPIQSIPTIPPHTSQVAQPTTANGSYQPFVPYGQTSYRNKAPAYYNVTATGNAGQFPPAPPGPNVTRSQPHPHVAPPSYPQPEEFSSYGQSNEIYSPYYLPAQGRYDGYAPPQQQAPSAPPSYYDQHQGYQQPYAPFRPHTSTGSQQYQQQDQQEVATAPLL